MQKKLLVLPGDGIGPEVMQPVYRLMDWFARYRSWPFDVSEGLIGGASYDRHKVPLADAVLSDAVHADAVLLGAVGGPQWESLDFALKPERGLLGIRKGMGLFANLRPATVLTPLAHASTLKPDVVMNLDMMIVRELTGGIYFGEPRGIRSLDDGQRQGINTLVYTTSEIRRIGRVAFEIAKKRKGKVCSVDKANVLECTLLWREEMTRLHEEHYAGQALSHLYVDNAAMQLVRNPGQFDVIVTTNMFGDILSDCAAMLTGSLGMLPSASLGDQDHGGAYRGLYEPVHGSAPDIAGKGMANPLGMVLSFAMCLRYSLKRNEDADMLEKAVKRVLEKGFRTPDIMEPGMTRVSTSKMGDALMDALKDDQ